MTAHAPARPRDGRSSRPPSTPKTLPKPPCPMTRVSSKWSVARRSSAGLRGTAARGGGGGGSGSSGGGGGGGGRGWVASLAAADISASRAIALDPVPGASPRLIAIAAASRSSSVIAATRARGITRSTSAGAAGGGGTTVAVVAALGSRARLVDPLELTAARSDPCRLNSCKRSSATSDTSGGRLAALAALRAQRSSAASEPRAASRRRALAS